MEGEILGYDCDGNELYQFDIVRAIFYSDIDFELEKNIDPRNYCVLKATNGTPYLISVYDRCNKKAINLFEKRDLDEEVPTRIKPMKESINYEIAYDFDNKRLNYDFDKQELQKRLNICRNNKKF